jgi:peptidoglycan/LPS O-acetylase OafA/YrhL
MAIGKVWSLDGFTHTWSLAIEDQFYFVAPVIFLLSTHRKIVWLIIALIVAIPIARLGVWFADSSQGFRVHVLTPFRIDTPLAGICFVETFF